MDYLPVRGMEMKIKINFIRFIGNALAIIMAYQLWGWKGCWFTIGLILSK
jgi:hypothetical protein